MDDHHPFGAHGGVYANPRKNFQLCICRAVVDPFIHCSFKIRQSQWPMDFTDQSRMNDHPWQRSFFKPDPARRPSSHRSTVDGNGSSSIFRTG
jgi:hypothetical protein